MFLKPLFRRTLPPDSAMDILPAGGWHDKGRKALGINRTTLYKKMKRYGIEMAESVA
jgi:hypothetical protein